MNPMQVGTTSEGANASGRRRWLAAFALVMFVAMLVLGRDYRAEMGNEALKAETTEVTQEKCECPKQQSEVNIEDEGTEKENLPVATTSKQVQYFSSYGQPYKICDNPITRTMDHTKLQQSIEKRFRFAREAFVSMYKMLNQHRTDPWEKNCENRFCKYTRGWSGLTSNRDRWVFIGDTLVDCPDKRSFASGDDEKRYCWSDELITGDSCVVFSIGSNNQWAFEEAIANRTNCKIHTFDCTVNATVPEAIRHRTTFHMLCIGSKENGPLYKTMDQLVDIAGVKKVDFFKMDVEGYEYEVILDIIKSSQYTLETTGVDMFPNQMAVEFHYGSWAGAPLPWWGRDISPGELYLYFETMFLEAGYLIADKRINPQCTTCMELLLVRVKC